MSAWLLFLFLFTLPAHATERKQTSILPSLSALAGDTVTRDNQLVLLVGGTEFYPVRLDLIRNANHQIDLFTFLWCPDESGFEIAEALAAAAIRGIRVRVGVDFFNNKGASHVYSLMEHAGVDLLIYNPPLMGWRVNDRMHEKIMIVDGYAALIGGANICDEYMLKQRKRGLWQDYEIFIRGPAAAQLQGSFDESWSEIRQAQRRFTDSYSAVSSGSPTTFEATTKIVQPLNPPPVHPSQYGVLLHYQKPYNENGESQRAMELYIELFDNARKRIVVHTPYMAPPKAFKDALISAASRGVEVKILTNSPQTNDLIYLFSLAARVRYKKLSEAGIRIFESPSVTIHGKAIVIDDTLAAVGSHNFTHRSFFQNREIKVLTNDSQVIDRLLGVFDNDIERFKEMTPELIHEKSPRGLFRVMGRSAGRFF